MPAVSTVILVVMLLLGFCAVYGLGWIEGAHYGYHRGQQDEARWQALLHAWRTHEGRWGLAEDAVTRRN